MHRFLIIIERAGDNFSAYSPDPPGCVATGATREDTERRMYEAIELHIEGLIEDKRPFHRLATNREEFPRANPAQRLQHCRHERAKFLHAIRLSDPVFQLALSGIVGAIGCNRDDFVGALWPARTVPAVWKISTDTPLRSHEPQRRLRLAGPAAITPPTNPPRCACQLTPGAPGSTPRTSPPHMTVTIRLSKTVPMLLVNHPLSIR